MPLVLAPVGRELKIVKISTDEKTKKHLESLGITVNSAISKISEGNGSTICIVKDGRLALDKSIATKIFVI